MRGMCAGGATCAVRLAGVPRLAECAQGEQDCGPAWDVCPSPEEENLEELAKKLEVQACQWNHPSKLYKNIGSSA